MTRNNNSVPAFLDFILFGRIMWGVEVNKNDHAEMDHIVGLFIEPQIGACLNDPGDDP